MDDLFSQFQLSLSYVPVVIKRSSLPRRSRPNDSLRTWTSLSTCTTVYNDVHPSEWMRTPGPRALPPWPTPWPPSPCPWTPGSPTGSCSISSPWGPKRGSAVIQPSSPYCVQLYSRSCVVFLHHICQIYQITIVSHSVHILTYCGASARFQTWCYCIQQCRS